MTEPTENREQHGAGREVWVRAYLTVKEPRTKGGYRVLFTDCKGSHWDIQFHPEDIMWLGERR